MLYKLKEKIKDLVVRKDWKSKFSDDEIILIKSLLIHFEFIKTYTEIKYCILNDISECPICPICKLNVLIFNKNNVKYNTFCSDNCANSIEGKEYIRMLVKQTCLEKYGVEHAFQNKDFQLKQKQTCLEKYGVEHVNKNKTVKEKIKQTCLDKYGVENVFQNKDFQLKQKQTCLEKYGVENVFQSNIIKEKMEQTCLEKYGVTHRLKNETEKLKQKQSMLEKYGVEYASQNKDIQDKMKQTCLDKYGVEYYFMLDIFKVKLKNIILEKYGVEYASQNKDIQEKMKQTCLDKYGVEYYSKSVEYNQKVKSTCMLRYGVDSYVKYAIYKEKCQIKNRIKYWDTFNKLLKMKNIIPLFDKEEYVNQDYKISIKQFHCNKCGKDFNTSYLNIQKIYCPHCIYRSKYEYEIKSWLESELSITNIKTNMRMSKHEIDIFLPDLNIGIEFHGLYWHSDIQKEKDYHQEKYLFFKERGIELIQIFENEWLQKEWIVKSIIKNKLKIIGDKIPARKCKIKELTSECYKQFCELNHIQGHSVASIKLGLFYNEELVQLISFAKPRYNKNYEYELIRSCTKVNTLVIGGFEKLFSYFVKTYEPFNLLTYTDVRYFNGNSYSKVGFKLESLSKPDYFYFKTKDLVLYHRSHFQKHKLKDKLELFDETLTEYENMINNKYLRIFDAGNLVFTWGK